MPTRQGHARAKPRASASLVTSMAAKRPPASSPARMVAKNPAKSRVVSKGVSSRKDPSVVVCATGRARRARHAAVQRVVDVFPFVPVTPTVKRRRLHSGGGATVIAKSVQPFDAGIEAGLAAVRDALGHLLL